jgi:murein DD-endopeptidase MepM/ murein hydrolase activator NlpD/uncharacterized coiled-coil protein SlyX
MADFGTKSGGPSGFREKLNNFFRERELILRSEGRIRYVRLSPFTQKAMVSGVAAMALWLAGANGFAWWQELRLQDKQAEIAEASVAYERLRGELSVYQDQIASLASDILARRGEGSDLPGEIDLDVLEQVTAGIEGAFERISRDLDLTEADRLRIIQSRAALHDRITELETALAGAETRIGALDAEVADQESALASERAVIDALTDSRDDWRDRAERVEVELTETVNRVRALEAGLASARDELDAERDQVASLTETRSRLSDEVIGLSGDLAAARARVDALESELETTVAALGEERSRAETLSAIRSRLDAQVATLRDGLALAEDRGARLNETVASLTDALERVERDRIAVASERRSLSSDLAVVEAELSMHQAATERTQGRLEAVVRTLAELTRDDTRLSDMEDGALVALEGRIADISSELRAARGTALDMEAAIGDVMVGLSKVAGKPPARVTAIEAPEEKVDLTRELLQAVEAVQDDQQILIARLSEQAASEITRNERVLAMAGLEPDTLLRLSGFQPGTGGPFIPLEPTDDGATDEAVRDASPVDIDMSVPSRTGDTAEMTALLADEVEILESRLIRMTALNELMRCVPLISPVDNFQLTSPFGPRKDPITGKYAMHEGIDIGGWSGIRVHATAPGVVTYVGRNGGYGKMVEIDHGCGVRTVYAHLKRTNVEIGDVVDHRAVVGALGNTGRSTGPHVHYEVIVDDEPVDPEKLIEAGRHVHKT